MTDQQAAALAEKRRKNAERQRAFKKRQKAAGLVQFTALVPEHAIASLMQAIENMRANGDLEIRVLHNATTGKMVGLK